jgi:cell division protein FtsI (penicillin-binding protein 3)
VGAATMSFGHGIAVNLLQLAAAYRVLASGGFYKKPTLVLSTEHPDGSVTMTPTSEDRQILRPSTVQLVNLMLEAVTREGGTGWRASVEGYRVAGKTGTAQKLDPVTGGYSDDLYIASFVGFVPADDPRVVIAVTVDEPLGDKHTGGAVAAPVFSEIAGAAMRHLKVLPSSKVTGRNRRPRSEPAGVEDYIRPVIARLLSNSLAQAEPGNIPSFVGLTARQAVGRYSDWGIDADLEVEGTGVVVRQDPSPGNTRQDVTRLRLILGEK